MKRKFKLLAAILMALSITLSLEAHATGAIRFSKDQIHFTLVNSSTGGQVSCEHELLSHVPWWKVRCDDREYTVDTWVQIRSKGDLFENTLMYHVSEGLQSSGEKLVQFKSHLTSLISQGQSNLVGIRSQIDVRNGQADLIMDVR